MCGNLGTLQGYLAHEKTHPARTLPQAYAQGHRGGGRFLMSEVPLYREGAACPAEGPLLLIALVLLMAAMPTGAPRSTETAPPRRAARGPSRHNPSVGS